MKKILSGILIALFFSMTFLSCGLDTFYVVNPPVDNSSSGHASVTNDTPEQNYVDFYSNENQANDFRFDGTYIYYKIYQSSQRCTEIIAKIEKNNNDTSSTSAYSVLENQSYQQLYYIRPGSTTAEPYRVVSSNPRAEGNLVYVKIRLTDNLAVSELPGDNLTAAYIQEGRDSNAVIMGVPAREISGSSPKLFNFGWHSKSEYSDSCAEPLTDDNDKDITTSSERWYYVDLWATGVGFDTTFIPYHSQLIHLGVIKVNADSERNF